MCFVCSLDPIGKDEEGERKQKIPCEWTGFDEAEEERKDNEGGGWYQPEVDLYPPVDDARIFIPTRNVKSLARHVPVIVYPWLDEW